jgi:hypothetical protein
MTRISFRVFRVFRSYIPGAVTRPVAAAMGRRSNKPAAANPGVVIRFHAGHVQRWVAGSDRSAAARHR